MSEGDNEKRRQPKTGPNRTGRSTCFNDGRFQQVVGAMMRASVENHWEKKGKKKPAKSKDRSGQTEPT